MSDPILNCERVNKIFMDCLFDDNGHPNPSDESAYVKAEGISCTVGLDPAKLEQHRAEIVEMLDELPDQFHAGWSFLNACEDKHGNLWTGLHQRMEQLFQLGIGIGKVECLLPRDLWASMPGGMPYYLVKA